MPTTSLQGQATAATPATVGHVPAPAPQHEETEIVEEELLVAEISIDGMCGVY
jgi:mycofactocin precursor